MAVIAEHDFEATKGETFREVVAVTIDIDGCIPTMKLRMSEKGNNYYTIPSDDITIQDVQVTIDGSLTTVDGIQIVIDADALVGIPALNYWYTLQLDCGSIKYVVLEGNLNLKTSTFVDCSIPTSDTVVPPSGCPDPPTITIVGGGEGDICYARPEPLYFTVTSPEYIKDIYVDRPGGVVLYKAKERGILVNDPSFAIQSDEYQVEFTRYEDGWYLKKPWNREGEYVPESIACGGSYCPDPQPFTITIHATDCCEQVTSQDFTVNVEGPVCCTPV